MQLTALERLLNQLESHEITTLLSSLGRAAEILEKIYLNNDKTTMPLHKTVMK